MVTDRETEKTLKAGFIGLGSMGMAMARNVAKAGLLDAVWNRTAATAELLLLEKSQTLVRFLNRGEGSYRPWFSSFKNGAPSR